MATSASVGTRCGCCAALLGPGGTVLAEAEYPGVGGVAGWGLQVVGCAAGPWFPSELAELAGLQAGDRCCAGRCFIELRHVSGW
jgi:hypothetical protein